MHDTAFHVGTLAMNTYANLVTASVLETGAQIVNDSLRANALPTTDYIGIDIEAGEGVEIVLSRVRRGPLTTIPSTSSWRRPCSSVTPRSGKPSSRVLDWLIDAA